HPVLSSSSAHLRSLPSFPTRRSSDLIGTLPPPRTTPTITAEAPVSLPDVASFKTGHYRPGLSLDHASQVGVGVSAGSGGSGLGGDRKSTRLNSSHVAISYAVFCLKKK